MDILREFLESRTTSIRKWVVVILMTIGITSSAVFVHSSFFDCSEFPVATTITPYSAADLPFMPKDTSDLPKSIKKALKYDLMKLTKRGLSFNMASQTLNSEGGQSLANLIGKRRIENTFRGFQVIFQDKDTIMVQIYNSNGTFEIPFSEQNVTFEILEQLSARLRIKFTSAQLNSTVETMMGDLLLILFLFCILATLVTLHLENWSTCYRQLQVLLLIKHLPLIVPGVFTKETFPPAHPNGRGPPSDLFSHQVSNIEYHLINQER